MNIALDYDGTFTSDPDLWLPFVQRALQRGHKVTVVTMRFESEGIDIDQRLFKLGVDVIYTDRKAKRPVVQALGCEMHIWIDDHPEAVILDASRIWGPVAPEGSPVIAHYD